MESAAKCSEGFLLEAARGQVQAERQRLPLLHNVTDGQRDGLVCSARAPSEGGTRTLATLPGGQKYYIFWFQILEILIPNK